LNFLKLTARTPEAVKQHIPELSEPPMIKQKEFIHIPSTLLRRSNSFSSSLEATTSSSLQSSPSHHSMLIQYLLCLLEKAKWELEKGGEGKEKKREGKGLEGEKDVIE
jgi:hypothetical protein